MKRQIPITLKGMRRRRIAAAMLCLYLPGMLLCGCADMTPEQKAAWGAAIGAVGGAAIGAAADGNNRGQGALIGAAAGAMIGGAAGYFTGKYQERQLASQEQVEREMAQQQAAQQGNYNGGNPLGTQAPPPPPPVNQPVVHVESVMVTPNTISGGSDVTVNATYVAYGSEAPPTGTIQLMHDGQTLASAPLDIKSSGRVQISKTLSLPADAASGPYVVVIILQHGPSEDQRSSTFNVG